VGYVKIKIEIHWKIRVHAGQNNRLHTGISDKIVHKIYVKWKWKWSLWEKIDNQWAFV
jgi:hypothetical protein